MNGDVNDFFTKRLASSGVSAKSPIFDRLVKKASKLSALGINSDIMFRRHFYIKKASSKLGAELNGREYSLLLDSDIESLNDAYFEITSMKVKQRGLTKVAYPNVDHYREDVGGEFDINRWLKTVHLIYDAVTREGITKENALDYYSNFLDIEKDEDLRFKKWFKYYSSGEHLKYSSEEDEFMKKDAVYMSNLGQGGTPYYHGGGGAYSRGKDGNNMPGDSFSGSTFDEVSSKTRHGAGHSEAFGGWKSKLHTAIRRIDKLLRTDKYMDSDTYRVLAEHLMNLSLQVQMLQLKDSLADVTHGTANKLNKFGFKEGADILKKVAQEIPDEAPAAILDEAPAAIPDEAPAAIPGEAPAAIPDEAPAEKEKSLSEESGIPSSDDVEPVKFEDIKPMPGARPGEYSELAGDVSLEDAAKKLDEVAGMLADRRIIRRLAEFDIMLDKIGIASMFPELAESQSKLIDSFSYALTRVTKMMGQLANAKTLIDAQSGVPGAPQADEAAAEPEPERLESGGEDELPEANSLG